jgi:hypothetical protein
VTFIYFLSFLLQEEKSRLANFKQEKIRIRKNNFWRNSRGKSGQVCNGTGTALSLLRICLSTHELLVKMEKFVKKTFSSCVTHSRYGIVGAFSPPKGTSSDSFALK